MSPSHAHYRPPDHSKGDESTIGGYAAVNDRPAAFEGSDGFSYSVELMVEDTGERGASFGGEFFLFIKWARLGAQTPEGHLESEYVVYADSEAAARHAIGQTSLDEVKSLLDRLIAEKRGAEPDRKWWDAMRDEKGEAGDGDAGNGGGA